MTGSPLPALPVPVGFAQALSEALRWTMPKGAASAIEFRSGAERVGVDFRDVTDQSRVVDALSRALRAIEPRFDYFPGLDVSIYAK